MQQIVQAGRYYKKQRDTVTQYLTGAGEAVPKTAYEFNGQTDEECCKKAQYGCGESLSTLWRRCQPFIKTIISKENRRQHLPVDEIPDAMQEAYFGFEKAIFNYRPENYSPENPASFRTFLATVIANEFSKYCRSKRNQEKYFTFESEDIPDDTPPEFNTYYFNDSGRITLDWNTFILNNVSSEKLAVALERLKPKDRPFIELWLELGCDKAVANELTITESAAKLKRIRIFKKLSKTL